MHAAWQHTWQSCLSETIVDPGTSLTVPAHTCKGSTEMRVHCTKSTLDSLVLCHVLVLALVIMAEQPRPLPCPPAGACQLSLWLSSLVLCPVLLLVRVLITEQPRPLVPVSDCHYVGAASSSGACHYDWAASSSGACHYDTMSSCSSSSLMVSPGPPLGQARRVLLARECVSFLPPANKWPRSYS